MNQKLSSSHSSAGRWRAPHERRLRYRDPPRGAVRRSWRTKAADPPAKLRHWPDLRADVPGTLLIWMKDTKSVALNVLAVVS